MTDLRKYARGKPCLIRVPGCTGGGDDTVLCHYRLSGYAGTALKPDDFAFGALGCSYCHDIVDGRRKYEGDRSVVRLMHAEGVMRTQARLVADGIVQC